MVKAVVTLLLLCYWLLSGVEAQTCGSTGKRCADGQARCVEGTCKCKPMYTKGDGFFACYTINQTYAELKNDPILNTFSNQKMPLPYPCRFMFTHVSLQLRDLNTDAIGTCEAIIHAFNDMVKGKIYTTGFDLALRLSYDNGSVVEVSVRNYGIARSGKYFFTARGTAKDYLPDGPFAYDDVGVVDAKNGVTVRNFQDRASNQIVLEAVGCGLRIAFLPYDVVFLRHQDQVPGLSVAFNCDHEPRFLSNDLTIALPSIDCHPGMLLEDIRFPGLSPEESMIARAFQTIVAQTQPNPNPECAAGHETMRDCNDETRTRAFNSCYWMLKSPRFIECVDDTTNGEIILALFNDCVSSFCNGVSSCADVVAYIVDSQCDTVPGIPKLREFVRGLLCP